MLVFVLAVGCGDDEASSTTGDGGASSSSSSSSSSSGGASSSSSTASNGGAGGSTASVGGGGSGGALGPGGAGGGGAAGGAGGAGGAGTCADTFCEGRTALDTAATLAGMVGSYQGTASITCSLSPTTANEFTTNASYAIEITTDTLTVTGNSAAWTFMLDGSACDQACEAEGEDVVILDADDAPVELGRIQNSSGSVSRVGVYNADSSALCFFEGVTAQ